MVRGAGKTEDGLVQYNEEVNRPEDDQKANFGHDIRKKLTDIRSLEKNLKLS